VIDLGSIHTRCPRGRAAPVYERLTDIPRPIGAILNKLDAEVDRLCSEAQLRAAA